MSISTSMVNFHVSLFYKMIETLPETKSTYYLKSAVENNKVTQYYCYYSKLFERSSQSNKKRKSRGAESRWRRNRTGDHFLFYKFIERTTER